MTAAVAHPIVAVTSGKAPGLGPGYCRAGRDRVVDGRARIRWRSASTEDRDCEGPVQVHAQAGADGGEPCGASSGGGAAGPQRAGAPTAAGTARHRHQRPKWCGPRADDIEKVNPDIATHASATRGRRAIRGPPHRGGAAGSLRRGRSWVGTSARSLRRSSYFHRAGTGGSRPRTPRGLRRPPRPSRTPPRRPAPRAGAGTRRPCSRVNRHRRTRPSMWASSPSIAWAHSSRCSESSPVAHRSSCRGTSRCAAAPPATALRRVGTARPRCPPGNMMKISCTAHYASLQRLSAAPRSRPADGG